jgi:hypothetical protein
MPWGKSIARRVNIITTTSFSSDANYHESVNYHESANYHESLGTNKKQAPETQTSTYDVRSLSVRSQRRGGSLHSEIHLPASIRSNGRRPFNVRMIFLKIILFN